MNDQNPLPTPRTPQAAEPEGRRSLTGRWMPGLILIVLGVAFLLSNLSGFDLKNWWALFILIPAVGAYGRAWNHYQKAGTIDSQARQALFAGLLLTGVTAVFLFNLNWVVFGPVLLILLGLTLLSNSLFP